MNAVPDISGLCIGLSVMMGVKAARWQYSERPVLERRRLRHTMPGKARHNGTVGVSMPYRTNKFIYGKGAVTAHHAGESPAK